jgi:hypothetical protein
LKSNLYWGKNLLKIIGQKIFHQSLHRKMKSLKETHSITEKFEHLVDTLWGQKSSIGSDDLEFDLEEFEKSIVRGHLLHKEKNHWVKRYCKLTESEMFIYKSQESWENAEEPVDSCFIKSSVLDTPDLKDVPFVFSLFSHHKEGKLMNFFLFF